ncbi:MAG: glycoside hydrolase family 2 [Candidatus Marinimicrobia bacterium]|nr:glycoside hydrolase family 2 [Candidatus Neomarinimicrobiota bacterium]
MDNLFRSCIILLISMFILNIGVCAENHEGGSIPLPEHPRPDFQRNAWLNLNGQWEFQFDKKNHGIEKRWSSGTTAFDKTITVPFSWGSKLSGVKDEADIGWYSRSIQIPESWKGKRVFLVIGACDWRTTAWIDGKKLGEHQGGYTPFEFDLSASIEYGKKHDLVLRVDDTPHKFKLEGKQGYGRAAGIWQTIYLETRPEVALETIHFSPDIDNKKVKVEVTLDKKAPAKLDLQLQFNSADPAVGAVMHTIPKGEKQIAFTVPINKPHLWSLEDPYLYYVDARLTDTNGQTDEVATYFGMRKISVINLPGTDIPYVALNNKPIYLQLTLDQAYHPDGYYTFPSDAFMRDEIRRTKGIGLNGQRIHIKVEVPRKLYWADRLGVLIMADVPNSWGPPDANMRSETEYTLRRMVKRDYNHPSIFSWVNFNETWGLRSEKRRFKPETQEWVESVYRLTKRLDPTRLVEDNSPNTMDHVATDLNSWHGYLPGYAWRKRLDEYCQKTFPGSKWNYIGGRTQGNQPMLNSECGNVWGYEGSAGDVDWSWDYHIMINEFRRHPKVCGWLYTEHHDVINEWNGYWRYDRSNKYTGMSDLMPGMQLNDLHSKYYIASERELCKTVAPKQKVKVPLWISVMTDENAGDTLTLDATLYGWDSLGNRETYWQGHSNISCRPWMQKELDPIRITMPAKPALGVLTLLLKDASGNVLHRNFTTYLIANELSSRDEIVRIDAQKLRVLRFAPDKFDKAEWTLKQWNVLEGLKVNGAGAGFFEYRIPWPGDLKPEDIEYAGLKMELSAKQLFGKDKDGTEKQQGNFMRGKGAHDPSLNPNSYPMTDDVKYPSIVRIRVSGDSVGDFELPDDSADHRGILSWYSQKRDRHLREAGSYGYLVSAYIPADTLKESYQQKTIVVRLEVDDALAGGLAVYGERFGRYPIDPAIIIKLKRN